MTIVKKTVHVTAVRSPADINVSIDVDSDYVVDITTQAPNNVVVEPINVPIVASASLGPQGQQGDIGPQGPKGDPGASGTATYIHTQLTPSDQWIIFHNLSKYPSVMIVDSGGTVIDTDIHYDNAVQLTVFFGSPTSGKAYLN